jgi:release factor glutamine methyltransferase
LPTIHELVAWGRQRLRDTGIPSAEAELDGRVLIERLLRWDTARYFSHGDQDAPPPLVSSYRIVIERRAQREPVAYLTGTQEFWGLEFEVTPDVMIPRPETELIVETLFQDSARAPLRLVDCCTGSGCLAVAIARQCPNAWVVATDVSASALAVAARNITRHGMRDRIRLVRTRLLSGFRGPFDLIVANPPYVPETDRASLPLEVVDHEPHLALFAGPDGLDVIRELLAQAPALLIPGGWLVFELGLGQMDGVADLIKAETRFESHGFRRDLQGIPRVGVARRV